MYKENIVISEVKNEDFDLLSRNRDFINENAEKVADQFDIRKIEFSSLMTDSNYRSELVEQDIKETDDVFQKFVQMAIAGEHKSGTDFAFVNLQRNLSIIQEVLMAKLISELKIFKDGVDVSLASEYDDTFNHTDVIAEEREAVNYEESLTTFDITFSKTNVIEKLDKLEKMTKFINTPTNGKIKNYWELRYYKSELTGNSGQIDFSPKLILGLSVKHILELYKSYTEKNFPEPLGACLGLDKRYDYDYHPAKILILEEMIAQAEYLKNSAIDKKNARLESRYAKLFLALNNRLHELKLNYASNEKGQKVLDEIDVYKIADQVYTNLFKKIQLQPLGSN